MYDFPESERKIFAFHNGTREIKADPIALQRRLLRAMADRAIVPEDTFKHMEDDDDLIALDAMQRVIPAVRDAFALPTGRPEGDEDGFELADGAMTDEGVMILFGRFIAFQDDVKKNSETSPSSSPSTDGLPADSAADATAPDEPDGLRPD